METTFQKIYPLSDNRNSIFNEGWIHLDAESSIAAGVIYLTPDSYIEAGTSFYEITDRGYTYDGKMRDDLYLTIKKSIDKSTSKRNIGTPISYRKICEIGNRYNRCSFYGTQYPHRESNFVTHDTEPRLTHTFFIRDVKSQGTPLQKLQSHGIMI